MPIDLIATAVESGASLVAGSIVFTATELRTFALAIADAAREQDARACAMQVRAEKTIDQMMAASRCFESIRAMKGTLP